MVRALDLQLDDDKSFAWAALSRDRSRLATLPIACKLAARDLGAHQNYCRKAGNRTLVDRVKAMDKVWKLLSTCHSPFRLKCIALIQLAWPRALHGISVVKLGTAHYQSLRTGAARGLRASQIGSHPMLLLATVGLEQDPEAWSVLQTFRDARDIGNIGAMHEVLVAFKHFPDRVPLNGPTAILVDRLVRLGWDLDYRGLVVSDLGTFDLFQEAWASVHLRTCLAWPRVLATEVCHRKSFSGIQCADLLLVWESLKSYGEIDAVFLRCALTGTLYTDVGKDKSNRGSQSKCVHCGEPDSFRLCCVCSLSCTVSLDFVAG